MTTLAFHGAARTVTGSRYLLTHRDRRTLVDVGLFQGLKELRELNWRPPPFPAKSVDRVLLTHTHIDHAGALPRLVKNGFRGPVYGTSATLDLARLLLVDSARIQESDAARANRKGYSKHKPALPLYTEQDARAALELFEPVAHDEWLDLGEGQRARYHGAGHILGSASIEVRLEVPGGEKTVVFSGDVGRYDMPLHLDPQRLPRCDVLVCESTYGNRQHDRTSLEEQLAEPLGETLERKGTVLIPAFAVGRSQQITLILRNLMKSGALPEVPVHIDSPMAVDATRIYGSHLDEHHLDERLLDGRNRLFPGNVSLHRSVDESKVLNSLRGPRIIVSSSGMLSGGRILHHLRRLAGERRNLVVLAGYQAAGTRGRKLLEGARSIRIYGRDIPVRAETISIHGLSGHADQGELLRWMQESDAEPGMVYVTHGEPESSYALSRLIRKQLGWRTQVPNLDEEADLGSWL